jgi:hypothetical protein
MKYRLNILFLCLYIVKEREVEILFLFYRMFSSSFCYTEEVDIVFQFAGLPTGTMPSETFYLKWNRN